MLGLGFYGRSFTLQNPSCSTPGCPFSGASKPGPCSQAAGILAYYEIQEVLKNKDVKPVHDTTAAVKYITFDKNQWISYDDAETFKQKVDWANKIGLGGSLIWASDLGSSFSFYLLHAYNHPDFTNNSCVLQMMITTLLTQAF